MTIIGIFKMICTYVVKKFYPIIVPGILNEENQMKMNVVFDHANDCAVVKQVV